MLPRRSLPMLLFIGALALVGWTSVVVKTHMDGSGEMTGQYHGSLAGVLRPVPDRQFTAGCEIAGNAVPPGYFERARMLLYLLRSRHWRKAAYSETSQADYRT